MERYGLLAFLHDHESSIRSAARRALSLNDIR
jgi:hypothetical protein